MCCNGDGSHYDDDKWCAMSGALKIRNEIWMIYTKTYEAKRIISLMGGAKAAKKWSISVKQKLLEEKKLWMQMISYTTKDAGTVPNCKLTENLWR